MSFEKQIFTNKTDVEFEKLALEIFEFQYNNCEIYKTYVNYLNRPRPTSIKEIPFLPISFFKSHKVITDNNSVDLEFKSSGTGGNRSTHFVANKDVYLKSIQSSYYTRIGNPSDQIILALLPNYIEQGGSSLVYMVDYLITQTDNEYSGFYLNNLKELIDMYNSALKEKKQIVIFGVSYALMDLAELLPNLSEATIIETGGMKGRRKELTKTELHSLLKKGLSCENIRSEYGMTELLSQLYSDSSGVFSSSPSMRFLVREVNDPFSYCNEGKTGGVNIVDLANIYSCSFIATQDLGRMQNSKLELMGRFDDADIRGCNLLVQ